MAATAAVLAATHRQEVREAAHLVARVDLDLLGVAIGLEAVSIFALAALERWLLRAGGAEIRLGSVAGVVVSANAVAGAVPAGSVLALGWAMRQLERRGIALTVVGASLAAAGVMSITALSLLLTVGALVASPSGPAPGLREGVLIAAGSCVALLLIVLALSRSAWVRDVSSRAWHRIGRGRPRLTRLQDSVGTVATQALALHPTLRGWIRPLLWALLNWICDAAVLVVCMAALGIQVPWRGLLMAYTLTQFLGSLRVTPGNLGIAEASLSGLLVLYGLRADQALAATLLYRGVSFWLLQPIGWACWLVVTLHKPEGKHRHHR
ncbi:flippase-like domain-containing protein [Streptacidiphilus sp. NEAU-YB345]|uniref:Flippase-like domain-containing protein n=1 Tax=Streptacidiphilus fuscans TaxID=2789292 RepID=A0A931B2V0_9ACTN|nr:flippase-like domain-containing protein [Streptacidiphilus fuscans]